MFNQAKRILLTAVLVMPGLAYPLQTQANDPEWLAASEVVSDSTQAMIELLQYEREEATRKSEITGASVGLDEQALLAQMAIILDPVVDFESIAKGEMAKFYRRASAVQIEAFNTSFRTSLLNTYSRAVVAFKINNYEVQPNVSSSSKPGRQKVWVKVYANGAAYNINYAVKLRPQGWKVTNVTLDGINLGLAFRQQFATAMAQNKGNMDDVIAFWLNPA
ncbi:MAG: ABC transporter substrate-binding protein [Oceanospirillaceae bacterium]|nr:ABC transporter substrate-binding protein [Oceanospirillaceae bacterium]